jgi:hypothetical protein
MRPVRVVAVEAITAASKGERRPSLLARLLAALNRIARLG